jgi:hypothetical protein
MQGAAESTDRFEIAVIVVSLNFSMLTGSQGQEGLLEFCLQLATDDSCVITCVITLSVVQI